VITNQPVSLGQRALRDVGFGFGMLVVAGLLVYYNVHAQKELSTGWIGLAGFTPLTFWIVARQYRSSWRRPVFWLTLVALLVVHLLGFTILLRSYPDWRMIWFAPIMIIEVVLLGLVVEKAVL
jgi:hypothetical protein